MKNFIGFFMQYFAIENPKYIEMIKTSLLLIVGLILFSLACSDSIYTQEKVKVVEIPFFKSEDVIHLRKHQDLKYVSSLSLDINGQFDGHTELWLGTNRGAFNRKFDYRNGKIVLKCMADWYHDDCYIKLVPVGSSKGRITIKYTFHGS